MAQVPYGHIDVLAAGVDHPGRNIELPARAFDSFSIGIWPMGRDGLPQVTAPRTRTLPQKLVEFTIQAPAYFTGPNQGEARMPRATVVLQQVSAGTQRYELHVFRPSELPITADGALLFGSSLVQESTLIEMFHDFVLTYDAALKVQLKTGRGDLSTELPGHGPGRPRDNKTRAEVNQLFAEGRTIPEIAELKNISEADVKHYRKTRNLSR